MAKLNREQFLDAIKARIGDDTSDAAMQFVENMTDTFDGFSGSDSQQRISELEQQLNEANNAKDELDKSWRQKYRDRFFSGIDIGKLPPGVKDPEPTDPEPTEPDRATTIQVNDLFTEV